MKQIRVKTALKAGIQATTNLGDWKSRCRAPGTYKPWGSDGIIICYGEPDKAVGAWDGSYGTIM